MRVLAPWVSIAPLGAPVVPEVKMMSDTSPAPTDASRWATAPGPTASPPATASDHGVVAGAEPSSRTVWGRSPGAVAASNMPT